MASCARNRACAVALLVTVLLLCGCGSSHGAGEADSSNASRVSAHAAAPPLAAPPVAASPDGAAPAQPPSSEQSAARRPNIVFVLTDDLAWNLVRYMPHVLAMQRAGEIFSNYFVTDSLCCPSRASLLTGRFPHNTGILSNSPPYGGFQPFHERGEEGATFATALQARGYSTALMGKYLNGYEPAAPEGGAGPYVPPGWSEWDGVGDGYPEYGYRMNSNGVVSEYGSEPQDYLTDVLAREGLGFIDRAAATRRPFLLELATFAPHQPYTPAPRDAEGFPGLIAPRDGAFDAASAGAPAWLARFAPLDPEQIARIDRSYRLRAQSVQAVDRMIGEIEAELAARGLARNTYVVFSSDNGLHMGEHRLMPGKMTAFDSDIRVPLIVAGPGVPQGRVVDAMTENVDICPTFEQLGGAPVGANVDGHSLRGLLHGQPAPHWRREILVEHHGPDITLGDPDLPTHGSGNPPAYKALRSASSLYVEYVTGEREYYNLRRDPFELHNLAAHLTPAHGRRLHRALLRVAGCRGAGPCWRAQHGAT